MKYSFRLLIAVSGLLLLLPFSGCTGNPSEGDPASEGGATVSVPPLIDVDVERILSPEQVASILGVETVTSSVYEEGTWVQYTSSDGQTTADIHLNKCERELYDVTLSFYTDLTEAPNIGEAGYWSPGTGELLIYGHGYMIGIVVDQSASGGDGLIASRELAAHLLEGLA